MRLLDADALIAALEVDPIECPGCPEPEFLPEIIELLREAPTIDAVTVRHGRWIDETFKPWGLVHHPYRCSLCGEHAEYDSMYCPNCGANMMEVERETD